MYACEWGNCSRFRKLLNDVYLVKLTPEIPANSDFQKNRVKLFPNPVTNDLSIGVGEDIEGIKITVVLVTFIPHFESVKSSIDVSSLSSGDYFIVVQTKQSGYKDKFIKQ